MGFQPMAVRLCFSLESSSSGRFAGASVAWALVHVIGTGAWFWRRDVSFAAATTRTATMHASVRRNTPARMPSGSEIVGAADFMVAVVSLHIESEAIVHGICEYIAHHRNGSG